MNSKYVATALVFVLAVATVVLYRHARRQKPAPIPTAVVEHVAAPPNDIPTRAQNAIASTGLDAAQVSAQCDLFENMARIQRMIELREQFSGAGEMYPYTEDEMRMLTQAAYYCTQIEGARIGGALQHTRQFTNAIDVYYVLLSRNPPNEPCGIDSTECCIAESLRSLKRYDEAENLFTNIMNRSASYGKQSGVYVVAAYEMSEIRWHQRRYREALDYLDDILTTCTLDRSTRKCVEEQRNVVAAAYQPTAKERMELSQHGRSPPQ